MKILRRNDSFEIRGLSTESKPVVGITLKYYDPLNNGTYEKEVECGDIYLEIDTSKVYANNGTDWVEL